MGLMSNKYTAEIDNITREEWAQVLLKFDDANIFQTWEWGENNCGENKLAHIILKKSNEIVAASQVWYVKFPVIRCGFAHVSWGPMWRLCGKDLDFDNLRNMIKALYEEFVIRRGVVLRIRSFEIDNTGVGNKVKQIFENENLKKTNEAPYRTVILNLSPDMDELRSNLRKSWRRQLNKAEKEDIKLIEGTDEDMLNSLSEIYKDMVTRKRFHSYIENMERLKKIQKELPQNLKMRIFLCQYKGEFVSGQLVTTLGNTAMSIIAATSNKDIELKLRSTYFSDWQVIKWMKEEGFKYFGFRGYDPVKYPGPSYYKAGIGGNIVSFLDIFEYCNNFLSLIIINIAKLIVFLKEDAKSRVRKYRNRLSQF